MDDCDHYMESVFCETCEGYMGESCVLCGYGEDGPDHMATAPRCECIYSRIVSICDACGADARLSFWRKMLQPPHMDAGEWHCLGLCEICSADGPDMEGFERYA